MARLPATASGGGAEGYTRNHVLEVSRTAGREERKRFMSEARFACCRQPTRVPHALERGTWRFHAFTRCH